jgi:ribonuclease D
MKSSIEPSARGDPPAYAWVDSAAAFDGALEAIGSASRIAIDTEGDSLYHYFEKVCLLQISTRSETFLLDPLALRDLSGLAPILADPGVEKVFHAAGYDLSCLRRDYGFQFRNLYDTHLAAQLLGYEQLGLGVLLEKFLGVVHSKGRQRDDWSRRPLEREQLEYAATDTHHLLELRDLLQAELEAKERLEWALEEFEVSAAASPPGREFDPEGFRRIKGSRDLRLRELAVLRALYLLRDRCARELDLPPFKVLNDSVLVDLARHPPASAQALIGRRGLSYRVTRRFSGEIFRTIEEARAQDASFLVLPRRPPFKPPSREGRQRLERLKAWRAAKGRELGLHVGVVFPGWLLDTLAASPPSDLVELERLEGMRRWRARLFGCEILELVSKTA